MARSKLIASSLVVLFLLALSATAQNSKPEGNESDPEMRGDDFREREDFWRFGGGLSTCAYAADRCPALTDDDSTTQAAKAQAKTQKAQTQVYQAPDKNNPKEVELNHVIFNETGGLRANPKAKPSGPGSAENLHDARVAVGEVAERVLESNHPEREQAPHNLTNETVRDLNAGNKDVIRSLNDSLSAARSHSNTTKGAMHFRTGRHTFKSLYGNKAILYFGPFPDATGGKRYITIAP